MYYISSHILGENLKAKLIKINKFKKPSLYLTDFQRRTMQKRIKLPHALKLPDGSYLKYAFDYEYYKKGFTSKDYFRTKDTEELRLAMYNSDKLKLPKLSLNSNICSLRVICADFDTLPVGYESFSTFKEMLKVRFPQGIWCSSASGKVKGFFVVKFDDKKNKSNVKLLYMLKDILGESLFRCVDRSIGAIDSTFLTMDIFVNLKKYLSTREVFDYTFLYDKKLIYHSDTLTFSHFEHRFNTYKGKLPKVLGTWVRSSRLTRVRDYREKFTRIILSLSALENGFDLPITKLAREVGVDVKCISRMIDTFRANGFLKLIDSSYLANHKARRFKAIGLLYKVFRYFVQNKLKLGRLPLPNFVKDGNWNEIIWKYSISYTSRELKQFVLNLSSGHHKLDSRLKKVETAIKQRLIYSKSSILC